MITPQSRGLQHNTVCDGCCKMAIAIYKFAGQWLCGKCLNPELKTDVEYITSLPGQESNFSRSMGKGGSGFGQKKWKGVK